MIADTQYGQIEGESHGGVLRFAGIPYADAPLGPRRFRPPLPPGPWDGVRDATAYGPAPPQPPGLTDEQESEDCLFLNVFTPATDAAARPVMLWIHGGGYSQGSGSSAMYDGSKLASRGDVVVVTINYRLGSLGFLDLSRIDAEFAGSGNLGIVDQISALTWIRDNIAGFGGNASNVCVFGESAGGGSIGALLAMPAAQGLFHKAIIQSPPDVNVSRTSDKSAAMTESLMAHLGVATVAELQTLDIDRLVREVPREAYGVNPGNTVLDAAASGKPWESYLGSTLFGPVADGVTLSDAPAALIAKGSASAIPILVGYNRDEFNEKKGVGVYADDALSDQLAYWGRDIEAGLAAYQAVRPDADNGTRLYAAVTDLMFRIPAVRLAEAQAAAGGDVFMYRFDWESTDENALPGAFHGIEIPFVFGTHESLPSWFLGDCQPPAELTERVQDTWIAFARTGHPGTPRLPDWPAYDAARRATMLLNETCSAVEDPDAPTRRLWADIP